MSFRAHPADQPHVVRRIFTVLFAMIGGLVLAVLTLALKPVSVIDAPPKEPPAPMSHTVVYVHGKEGPIRQSQWAAMASRFTAHAAGEIEAREQDVNRWMAVTYGQVDRTKKWDYIQGEYSPGLPNVRFDGERTIVGIVSDVKALGRKWKFVVQTEGHFEPREGGPVFVPETVHVGSCPIPTALLRQRVYAAFARAFPPPAEAQEAWSAIQDVRVADDRMTLVWE